MTENEKDNVKNSVLTANTAQSVNKHLQELDSNRAHVLPRWIWELMQNARDASSEDGDLVASIERRRDALTFLHNGRGFRKEEIAHLIFHGSTKTEDDVSLGRFGSGFLTTHLLSAEIEVSGRLEDGHFFDFKLVRQADTSEESLVQSMEDAWESFTPSDALADPLPPGFSTRFRYPISTDEATSAVTEGLATLTRCAPLILVFNSQFKRIRIDDLTGNTEFVVTDRRSLSASAVAEVTVDESHEGGNQKRGYLLARHDDVSIALRIEDGRCIQQDGPRLYLGFPLIGTDRFSLPAAANSFEFRPTEARDGVYFGQSENEANRVNQQLVEKALVLHVQLIEIAARNGYRNSAALTVVPPLKEQSWLNVDCLRGTIQDKLIGPLRKTASVVTRSGDLLAPADAVLPYTEIRENVLELRRLLEGVREAAERLPSPDETELWCSAVRSWSRLLNDDVAVAEAWDGQKLAEYVDSKANVPGEEYGKLEHLADLLVDKGVAVEWLNGVIDFLVHNDFGTALDDLSIVLDQAGYLDKLPNLYRDCDVDDELKDIADELLDIGLRCDLRDTRIAVLGTQKGKGDFRNADAISRILELLRERAQETGASDAEEPRRASVRLLAWMLRNGCIGSVEHFPVWSEAQNGEGSTVIWLERTGTEEAELPLAPVKAWPSGLQEFADLFPRSRTLAASYFSHLPEPEHWNALEEGGLLRTNVILQGYQSKNFQDALPDEPLSELPEGGDHVSTRPVEVVNVAYFVKDRVGIMSRVPDAPKRGVLLWRFLTEYLIPMEEGSLEAVEADCECGESHGYFRAAWLEPLAKRKWVPLGVKQRDYANARSLAALLSDSPQLGTSKGALKLLSALGMTQLELTLEFLAGEGKEKADLDANLAKILEFTGGDLASVSQFVEDLAEDHGLMEHLDDRRKSRQRVQRNQKIGLAVERAVRECLEEAGFVVRRTGIGSDFEIEFDPLDDSEAEALGIEVIGHDRQWLIEVKATRGSEVRMTRTQARTAVEKGEQFLLCVVPLDVETVEIDQLPTDVRFVEGIGQHLHSLCDDLDELVAMREAATEEEATDGVRLEILGGKERICVSEILWCDAVSLPDLAAMLARTD